jgi:hypothetical protein
VPLAVEVRVLGWNFVKDAVSTVRAALEHADATPEFSDEVRGRAALQEAERPRVP